MRKINSIVLHCTATKENQDFHVKDIDKWHKQRGFKCIGYHFVIDLDGTIETGRPIEEQGAHCVARNKDSVGIVYVGGLDVNGRAKDTRTEPQKVALLALVCTLMRDYDISIDRVYCHNQFDNKACPCFQIEDLRQELLEYMEIMEEQAD